MLDTAYMTIRALKNDRNSRFCEDMQLMTEMNLSRHRRVVFMKIGPGTGHKARSFPILDVMAESELHSAPTSDKLLHA